MALCALLGPVVFSSATASLSRAQSPVPVDAPPAASEVAAPLSPADQRVVRALRATREKPPPPTDSLRKLLADDAAHSVECLVTILESRLVPAVDGPRIQHLSVLQEELVQGALRGLDRAAVMPTVEQHLAASSSSDTRAGAIAVLGLFGKSSDLRRLIGLATAQGDQTCDDRTSAALTHAITAVLQRDAAAFDELYRHTLWQSPAVAAAVVAGVGETRDPRGLPFLSELLVACPEVATEALAQVQLIGPSFNRDVDVECGNRALKYIDDVGSSASHAALLAVGTLESERAVPNLIALLGDEDDALRADVWWSLRRISGMELPAHTDEWSRWYGAEEYWYARERPRVLVKLHDRDRGHCAEAIRACMAHRLYRHQLAPALGELVRGNDPEMSMLAAQALGELASPVAIPWLNAAVEFDEPRVHAASRDALARIVARYPRLRVAGS